MQSSLLGPRTPEEVVRNMISGIAVLLHAADDEVVRDSAATLRNLMCSPGEWTHTPLLIFIFNSTIELDDCTGVWNPSSTMVT